MKISLVYLSFVILLDHLKLHLQDCFCQVVSLRMQVLLFWSQCVQIYSLFIVIHFHINWVFMWHQCTFVSKIGDIAMFILICKSQTQVHKILVWMYLVTSNGTFPKYSSSNPYTCMMYFITLYTRPSFLLGSVGRFTVHNFKDLPFESLSSQPQMFQCDFLRYPRFRFNDQ